MFQCLATYKSTIYYLKKLFVFEKTKMVPVSGSDPVPNPVPNPVPDPVLNPVNFSVYKKLYLFLSFFRGGRGYNFFLEYLEIGYRSNIMSECMKVV